MNRRVRSLSLFAAIAVAFSVIGAVPATACLVPPPQIPDIWVEFHSPTDVWITFHGYKTFGSDDTQFCACGLLPAAVGVIVSVDAVAVVDASTKTPIGGFNFSANANVSTALSAILAGSWDGFLSDMSASVAADIDVDLQIQVTVTGGTTLGDIKNALGPLGAGSALFTDEANMAGGLLGTHAKLWEGPFPCAIPTVTEWGMAAMVLLVLATGTIVFRRYSAKKSLA